MAQAATAEEFSQPPHWPAVDWRVVAVAGFLLVGGALALVQNFDGRQAALYLLGGAFGLVLYHATFGFASSWRRLVVERRGAGLRAQLIMLALATAVFLPVLDQGNFFGRSVVGAVAPVGISVFIGALLFGVGMQLGGACASGTLYTVGGGSTRMVVTLVFFVIGSLIGAAHQPWWLTQPSMGAVSILRELGLPTALLLQLGFLLLLGIVSVVLERHRHGRLEANMRPGPAGWRRCLQGPWPLIWGGVLLALLNIATLALAGHPWNISFGYTLWGAKAASALGFDVASWEFWTWRYPRRALEGSLFAETTSLMNFGIIAGALLAAGLAGRFAPTRNLALGPVLAAVVGGLLMGYGARLAFGCNVGAFFSGVASGSLHGWLWFLAALMGTWLGNHLRPLFGLDPTPSQIKSGAVG